MKKALITGISGQDGSYLAEFLLDKGYKVFGLVRRTSSSTNLSRIKHLLSNTNLSLIYGDLADSASLSEAVNTTKPDEIYNLGAMSHVRVSFDVPEYTADITGTGVLRFLEAIRKSGLPVKFYQASSSEMFGKASQVPQNEDTPFYPRSPYACAKVFANQIVKNYRESYGMFACNGILFNHESERRGEEFVTRKITKAVARIKLGLQSELKLGNIDSKRDWGHSRDFVRAMWLMLQQDKPDDYVVATGETHTVKEFLIEAFGSVGLDWQKYVKIDPMFLRPAEVDVLLGDYSKAKRILGWEPDIKFKELVKIMVKHDLEEQSAFVNFSKEL
jgi:GDPmannose 4,6-dehydratase